MLAILGSLAVGVAQFGASVFLAQYFQIARDHTPTQAGLLMLPLIVGNMVGATGTGQYITRTGRWKGIMLVGSVLLVAGLSLMGTIDHLTPMWHLSAYMVLMGLGTGALMQNLVLVVQNTVDVTDVGAASGTVSFFRSLGGTIGVAALGAVLASSVTDKIATGLARAGIPVSGDGAGSLDLDKLPPGGGHHRPHGVRRRDRTHLPDRRGDRGADLRGGGADAGDRAAHHDPQGRGRGRTGRAPRGRPGLSRHRWRRTKAPVESTGAFVMGAGQERKPTCPVTLVEMST